MKKIFLLLFCISVNLSISQGDGVSGNTFNMGIKGNSSVMSQTMLSKFRVIGNNKRASMNNVKGSAYLTEVFMPTRLQYNQEFINNIFYRFNAYNGEIEVKPSLATPDESINALSRDKKITILVDGNPMSFKTFVTSNNKTLNGYLISLYDGNKYDLFKREYIIFSQGRISTNSFVKAVPSRFVKFTEYYLQKEGVNRIDEIILTKKNLVKLLDGSIKSNIKNYIKVNKLNIKDEQDLLKVFVKLNQ